MVDSLLSPEEINALLKKTEMKNDELSDEQSKGVELADIEKDVLGEIANIFMGSAATALSLLLGRRTVITAPRVMLTTPKKIWKSILKTF
jgi:flagellar motor switch protein FliN/FliY